MVGIPEAIVPALREHLNAYVGNESGALLFPAAKGGPLGLSRVEADEMIRIPPQPSTALAYSAAITP